MRLVVTFIFWALVPAVAFTECGGDFAHFKAGLIREAGHHGISRRVAGRFLANVAQDPAVLKADRAQGVFQKPFIEFSQLLISPNRLSVGREKARRYADSFARVQHKYGVDPTVLLALWAFETDYGAFMGNFNTASALVTLAHDCRRPGLFRPQVFAAMQLYEKGAFDPDQMTGAWAGEIGMVQMLPQDIIDHGVDADGDGHVDLKASAADALLSGAKMLQHLGWRPNEPWLQEVNVPANFDWSQSGLSTTKDAARWHAMGVRGLHGPLADLPASLILPQGRHGPAFLSYPNFRVYFDWNQSFTYVLTAAYFATRLGGAPVYNAANPDPGLGGDEMKILQHKLRQRGYDVGKIDGILGAGTRAAVQAEQKRLNLPADAWPTRALLDRL